MAAVLPKLGCCSCILAWPSSCCHPAAQFYGNTFFSCCGLQGQTRVMLPKSPIAVIHLLACSGARLGPFGCGAVQTLAGSLESGAPAWAAMQWARFVDFRQLGGENKARIFGSTFCATHLSDMASFVYLVMCNMDLKVFSCRGACFHLLLVIVPAQQKLRVLEPRRSKHLDNAKVKLVSDLTHAGQQTHTPTLRLWIHKCILEYILGRAENIKDNTHRAARNRSLLKFLADSNWCRFDTALENKRKNKTICSSFLIQRNKRGEEEQWHEPRLCSNSLICIRA